MEVGPAPKYSMSYIPGEFERRVFIGGNYDNILVLRQIEKMVGKIGFQPIIALDFDVPEDQIRDCDLRLLHNSKYAIFEITVSNGHLTEIEWAILYNAKTLLVYQVRDEKRKPPSGVTSMLLTSALPKFGYLSFDELEGEIRSFLEAEAPGTGPPTPVEKITEVAEWRGKGIIDQGIIFTGKVAEPTPSILPPVEMTLRGTYYCPSCQNPLPQPTLGQLIECPNCHTKIKFGSTDSSLES